MGLSKRLSVFEGFDFSMSFLKAFWLQGLSNARVFLFVYKSIYSVIQSFIHSPSTLSPSLLHSAVKLESATTSIASRAFIQAGIPSLTQSVPLELTFSLCISVH